MKVGAFFLVALLGVGGFFIFSSMKADARFTEALTLCEALDASGVTLAEDGQSLNFDDKGKDDLFGGDYIIDDNINLMRKNKRSLNINN
jgi:hypothetical protein